MPPTQQVGVLVRLGGKRVNRAKLMQQDVDAMTAQIQQLTQQNALLRAKEAMQFSILRNYEDALHHMGVLLCELAGRDSHDAQDSVAFLAAAMLDLRAAELLKQLREDTSAYAETDDTGSAPSSTGDIHPSCSPGSSCSSGTGLLEPQKQLCARTKRLWASVTPEAVLEMKGITTEKLAERFKGIVGRMALVKECTSLQLTDTLDTAADAYALSIMLSMVAADEQFLQFTCMNLDTMQPDTPPESLWSAVVSKADLQPQQRQEVYLAFECYRDHRAALLQQQHKVVQQLQALLAPQQPMQHALPCNADSTAAAAAAAATADSSPELDQATTGDASAATRGSGGGGGGGGVVESSCCAKAPGSHTTSCTTTSKGCSEQDSLGVLSIEVAEQAEQLLQQLDRIVRLQREHSRRLVYLWMDLLTTEQHVNAILSAYPFTIKVPAVAAVVWRGEAAQLSQEL